MIAGTRRKQELDMVGGIAALAEGYLLLTGLACPARGRLER